MSVLEQCFKNNRTGVFMAHLVAGYPSMDSSAGIARTLIENGADIIEVQIPFTDPLADGPVIMDACGISLEQGTTPQGTFKLVSRLTSESHVPVVVMTYCSIPLKMGLEQFVKTAAESGASGLIVPDLPFDSPEGRKLWKQCSERGVALIPVVSPGMDSNRLQQVLSQGSGFVYATLKVGITGSSRPFHQTEVFLQQVYEQTDLPVVAGFGISQPDDVGRVCNCARGVVVGSHLLRLFNSSGLEAVGRFAREVSSRIQEVDQNVSMSE